VSPWKLPLLVIAIVVPTVAAFWLGGPGVGVAVGALAGVGLIVLAVRDRPRGAIGETPPTSDRGRILVVVGRPVEDQWTVRRIAAAAQGSDAGQAEVLVLAPARLGFLDRWASDLEGARHRAQQNLVIAIASLAKAGVAAEGRVGDEDLVQAVEDTVPAYAPSEVILVTAGDDDDPSAASAAAELAARLRPRFQRLTVSDPAAR
jgi:hypothetical protein